MKIFFVLLLASALFGDRCASYVQDVRKAHYGVFGVNFPYQYGVAQLIQESGCRNILSLDGVGSEGLPQITYRVWKKPLEEAGVREIKTLGNQFKAQAIIMHSLHNPKQALWVTYQKYNGGGLVLKEISRAGAQEWAKAKEQCKRGQSCFTYKGKTTCRSNCEINYEYSQNIFKYAKNYSTIASNQFRFW